jgi:hypothetical protein
MMRVALRGVSDDQEQARGMYNPWLLLSSLDQTDDDLLAPPLRSEEAHAGGISYDVLLQASVNQSLSLSPWGALQDIHCVCGCSPQERARGLSRVRCSFAGGTWSNNSRNSNAKPSFCILHRPFLFASSSPLHNSNNNNNVSQPPLSSYFGTHAPRIPLLVAVCDLVVAPLGNNNDNETETTDILTDHGRWSFHTGGGVAFDHVREHRLTRLPASDVACRRDNNAHNATTTTTTTHCRLPVQFQWAGRTPLLSRRQQKAGVYNGWTPLGTWEDDWVPLHTSSSKATSDSVGIPHAPQLHGSTVAYVDAGDCWMDNPHRRRDNNQTSQAGEPLNPWHCKAGLLNWNILSGLLEHAPAQLLEAISFRRTNARFFLWQGYDEVFLDGQPNGVLLGHDDLAIAVGGGVETSMHDDDHMVRDSLLADKRGLKGYTVQLQGSVPLAVLNIPPWHSFLWKNPFRVLPDDDHKPSQVIMDYRNRLLRFTLRNLRDASTVHPLQQLLSNNYSSHVEWILPQDPDRRKAVEQSVAAHLADYANPRWQMDVLPNVALMWRRSPVGASAMSLRNCKRCLVNIDEIAQAVANDTGMGVLLLHPTSIVPAPLQVYAVYATKLLVAMHGGAWGFAAGLGPRQAAVEILPVRQRLDASHIPRLGGAAYRCYLCFDCRGSLMTGAANVTNVLHAVRDALAEVAGRTAALHSPTDPST